MSSYRPDDVEDCVLEDLSQKPGLPDPTLGDAVSAVSTEYEHSMSSYAQKYNLHEESLLRMFSTQGQGSEFVFGSLQR